MSAISKAQQKAAGAALAATRDDTPVDELNDASLEMYKSMTERELAALAETGSKTLPQHVRED